MPAPMYKHLIILVTLVAVTGLSLILKLWPYGMNRTFSQHIARHKTAIIYYVILFTIILPMLLLYIFKWFIPTFDPPVLFGLLIIIAAVSQFACALIPETGGRMSRAHQILAYLSADCLLPVTFLIVLTPQVSQFGRATALIASLLMAVIAAVFVKAYAKNGGAHKYLLLLQATYFALFFTTLLVVTYSG